MNVTMKLPTGIRAKNRYGAIDFEWEDYGYDKYLHLEMLRVIAANNPEIIEKYRLADIGAREEMPGLKHTIGSFEKMFNELKRRI